MQLSVFLLFNFLFLFPLCGTRAAHALDNNGLQDIALAERSRCGLVDGPCSSCSGINNPELGYGNCTEGPFAGCKCVNECQLGYQGPCNDLDCNGINNPVLGYGRCEQG